MAKMSVTPMKGMEGFLPEPDASVEDIANEFGGRVEKPMKKTMFKRPPKTLSGLPYSLMKSAIQKSVRRCDERGAVLAAKECLAVEEVEFLRRWLVIIIEDAILHPVFGRAVDMLKRVQSSGGTPLTAEEKDELITSVAQCAAVEVRDIWVDAGSEEDIETRQYVLDNEARLDELPDDMKSLLGGLLYRSKIGGLKGDIAMLGNYHYLWSKRFMTGEWSIERLQSLFPERDVSFDDVPPIGQEDILPVSADFHCTPLLRILMKKDYVHELLTKTYPEHEDHDALLKGILWRQMSSTNHKKILQTSQYLDWYLYGKGKTFDKVKDSSIYEAIEREIVSIERWYIRKSYEEAANR